MTRDDLESLGYLLSALFHGLLPWDNKPWDIWRVKMSTHGSTLFRDMDPSFLEYWQDVRSLAFNEVPEYSPMKSRFVKCWERKGFGGSPGEFDWLALFNRLNNGASRRKTPVPPPEISAVSVAPSMIAPSHSYDRSLSWFLSMDEYLWMLVFVFFFQKGCGYIIETLAPNFQKTVGYGRLKVYIIHSFLVVIIFCQVWSNLFFELTMVHWYFNIKLCCTVELESLVHYSNIMSLKITQHEYGSPRLVDINK